MSEALGCLGNGCYWRWNQEATHMVLSEIEKQYHGIILIINCFVWYTSCNPDRARWIVKPYATWYDLYTGSVWRRSNQWLWSIQDAYLGAWSTCLATLRINIFAVHAQQFPNQRCHVGRVKIMGSQKTDLEELRLLATPCWFWSEPKLADDNQCFGNPKRWQS